MSLDVNDRNEWELKILTEFQEKVSDLKQDEITCLRFLIAREFKLDRAEEMLRKSVAWRENIGIENFSSWTWKFMAPAIPKEDWGIEVTGVSHNGGPVLWIPIGRWKARYWIENGKQEEATLYGYHILETLLTQMKKLNNKQAVAIFGIETLSFYKVSHLPTMKVLYGTFQLLEQNYPEVLQSLIAVNAPMAFPIAFNFIKPILSPATLNKVKIYGSDRDEWLAALREVVPDSAIPSDYLDPK